MKTLVRAASGLSLLLMLTGCFQSEQPLISVLESQAPVPQGIYTYTEDGATKQVAVSVDWPATILTTTKSDGSLEVDRFYMRVIRDGGYYVVMDKSSNYALIRVGDGQVDLYKTGDDCDQLQDLGEVPEETEYEYDVEITGDTGSTCKFKDFDNLARAYNALLDDKSLGVERTYVRQD